MLFGTTIITLRCTRPFETIAMVARAVSLARLIQSTCGQKVKKKVFQEVSPIQHSKIISFFFDRRCDWNIHALIAERNVSLAS